MKRVSSTLRGSFRGVAIAITLVSIITFSTIFYSVYRVYQSLTASGGLKGITKTTVIQGTMVVFSLNGSIPNNGLYPIDLSFTLSAESGGRLLTEHGGSSAARRWASAPSAPPRRRYTRRWVWWYLAMVPPWRCGTVGVAASP